MAPDTTLNPRQLFQAERVSAAANDPRGPVTKPRVSVQPDVQRAAAEGHLPSHPVHTCWKRRWDRNGHKRYLGEVSHSVGYGTEANLHHCVCCRFGSNSDADVNVEGGWRRAGRAHVVEHSPVYEFLADGSARSLWEGLDVAREVTDCARTVLVIQQEHFGHGSRTILLENGVVDHRVLRVGNDELAVMVVDGRESDWLEVRTHWDRGGCGDVHRVNLPLLVEGAEAARVSHRHCIGGGHGIGHGSVSSGGGRCRPNRSRTR
mmetsp:Transcript_19565/g.42151  ORF Transcript_19565/g.42151 Transcript_19565/m.42151 type:complete len:262 (-) Transcript_19565:403-1188(-)